MYDSQMEERRAKIIEERSMYYLDSNVKKTILALLDRSFVLYYKIFSSSEDPGPHYIESGGKFENIL